MDQKLEFNRMIRSIGRVPHSDNLMVTRETAMPELVVKLGLDPEREHTLVFVRRRVLADETPVLYSTDISAAGAVWRQAAGYDRFQPPDF